MLIGGFTVDVNGNESPDGDAPVREDWIYGAVGTNASPGATLQVGGTLAIGSNQAPPLQLNATRTPNEVVALVEHRTDRRGLDDQHQRGRRALDEPHDCGGHLSVQATSAQLTASGALAGERQHHARYHRCRHHRPGADLSVFIYM